MLVGTSVYSPFSNAIIASPYCLAIVHLPASASPYDL